MNKVTFVNPSKTDPVRISGVPEILPGQEVVAKEAEKIRLFDACPHLERKPEKKVATPKPPKVETSPNLENNDK